MNKTTTAEMTVLFADVAGSVQLYDLIGDVQAHQKIVDCLKRMTEIVEKGGGRVVEIIGDELMSIFQGPDAAFDAACEIQKSLAKDSEFQLGVRIGFHFGQTAEMEGHPYGDTVNVAARMVNMAKPGQIITNYQTREHLASLNQVCMRYVDRVFVKGKKVQYDLHEVVWNDNESTVLLEEHNTEFMNRRGSTLALFLTYAGRELKLTESSGELNLGRGPRCGLVVYSNAASRLHGTVSCQNGKMIYKDQSTNGTYIRTLKGKRSADSLDAFVHYEEWVSGGSGMLSLGEPITDNDPNLVYFRVE